MNNTIKYLLVTLAGVIVLGAVYFFFFYENSEDNVDTASDSIEDQQDTQNENDSQQGALLDDNDVDQVDDDTSVDGNEEGSDTTALAGVYTSYSPELLTDDTNILFFHAGWCPTCKVLNDDLVENKDQIPSDVTILKVDFDSEKDLREKYNVNVQHTLVVVDAEGNEVDSFYGSNSLEDLLEEL